VVGVSRGSLEVVSVLLPLRVHFLRDAMFSENLLF
jgi:hypothetical protein